MINGLDPISVLVVEDEETYRLSIEIALKMSERYTIDVRGSGEEAIKALGEKKYEIVLLDNKISGMSGLDVMKWIHEKQLSTAVIMFTGVGSEAVAVEAMKLGAYDYLSKEHIDIDRLPLTVNNLYERYRYRQEREEREKNKQIERIRDADLQALRIFEETIHSISLFTENGLNGLMANIKQAEESILKSTPKNETKHVTDAFKNLRTELETISSGFKSMMQMSKLVSQRLEHIKEIEKKNGD